MLEKYNVTKSPIPENQLVEIKFEHFEKNMKDELVRIYEKLNLIGLDKAMPRMEQYLETIGSYKRSYHSIDKDFKKLVDSELGDLVEL